ncbi:MAG: carbon-nitrogen hydrolase [Chloroflexi bacterium]|nr:MAG: carbon-nitrogen hydrolase [Chloroflexota bacterium]RLC84902.1 MAG: carbon-nitrogen hydrolase [Chloroflexota bacterium]
MIKLALIQMTCGDDLGENYDKAVGYIRKAAGQGAHIVCTQELFKSRYFCQTEDSANFDLAEEIADGSGTVAQLSDLAAELSVVIVASLFEKRAVGLYHNTAVVLDADGSYLGKYRKMHIPDDPLYYEKFYFAPGDLGYKVFRTRYADIGVLICWDQWFPEASRLAAMGGAELILIPTAIGHSAFEDQAKAAAYRDGWQIVQRGHAVANACFLAAVNRVGFEESPESGVGIDFWGRSFVADPNGQIVEQAAGDREELLICSIDLAHVEEVRKGSSFPFRDRRVDSYSGLTKLYLD